MKTVIKLLFAFNSRQSDQTKVHWNFLSSMQETTSIRWIIFSLPILVTKLAQDIWKPCRRYSFEMCDVKVADQRDAASVVVIIVGEKVNSDSDSATFKPWSKRIVYLACHRSKDWFNWVYKYVTKDRTCRSLFGSSKSACNDLKENVKIRGRTFDANLLKHRP